MLGRDPAFLHLAQDVPNAHGLILVNLLQGKAHMYQHIVTNHRIGSVGQIDGFLNCAKAHPSSPVPWFGSGVNGENLSWNGETHGEICQVGGCSQAPANAWPMARPPSLAGNRAGIKA